MTSGGRFSGVDVPDDCDLLIRDVFKQKRGLHTDNVNVNLLFTHFCEEKVCERCSAEDRR